MNCSRCLRTENIERHHIILKSEGGSNNKKNLRDLCRDCHDYVHTRKNITDKLLYYQKMLKLLEYRLQVLEELNTVDLIKEFGYRSYWIVEDTHGGNLGRKKFNRRRK